MKATKRSLIVSIAILCVCALSLTSASFAWFSASKTAEIQDIEITVKAQSDIRIAANEEAMSDPTSDFWKTTLTPTDFAGMEGAIIRDLTPTNKNDSDEPICDGSFSEPENRENVDSESGDLLEGSLTAAGDGWLAFKVYVRTTGQKAVAFSNTTFTLNTQGATAPKVANALCLGETNKKAIYNNATLASNETIIEVGDLTDIGDGYYAGDVTFYIWVEGTHADAKNVNALSDYTYGTTINFSYAA